MAAVETMQAEIVQLHEIVNQQANGKSGGARPRSSLVTTEALCVARAVHLALLIIMVGTVIIAIKCGSVEHFMVNWPKVTFSPESENMKWQPSRGGGSCHKYKCLLSNSCKTRRNTAKDEQKYQLIFLLVFSGSRVTVSGILIHKN